MTPGTRLGAYEVVGLLGAGGMGEVYRARDTKLDREVAIKVLPELFVSDPERIARFHREAKTLASLNHPRIGGIHGLEETSGLTALVLEMVEGPTLADRIAQGPLPVEEAVSIAVQIAEALEAAHEHGIIHRDLKPANIKVRADGTVKVLDFGLAKALTPEDASASLSVLANSPTITAPIGMTGVGVLLGTVAYMSPEQAKGRLADKRSDVWSFGCVLFEILTGSPPFRGEGVSDTIAELLKSEPAWSRLPPELSHGTYRLLKGCLEKDRRARVSDFSVVRFVLSESPSAPPPTKAVRAARWGVITAISIMALVAGSIGALVARLTVPSSERPSKSLRFSIVPAASAPLSLQGNDREIAMSPDGSRFAYFVGTSQRQLAIHDAAVMDEQRLGGRVIGSRAPFFSPDGNWVGYFVSAEAELRRAAITGGAVLTICRVTGVPRGASWADATIVFATTDPETGLLSVSADGGNVTVLTRPDLQRGERDHVMPSVLPGGEAVLFTIVRGGAAGNTEIAVLDKATGIWTTLIHGGSHAEYIPSGHLVYAASGKLYAARFDASARRLLGEPHRSCSKAATQRPALGDHTMYRSMVSVS